MKNLKEKVVDKAKLYHTTNALLKKKFSFFLCILVMNEH